MSQPAPAPDPVAAPPQPASAPPPSRPAPAAAPPPRAPTPPPPKPDPVRAKALAAKLQVKFPELKVDWMREKRLKVTTTADKVKAVALSVRDDLGFNHISAVSGVDWIAQNQLEVVYFVASTAEGWLDFVVALAERIPRDDPSAPTLIPVWPGAEFQERETHEMFGINFQGHPNLNHILLPEDWNDLPPLRKDYVSPGR